MLVYNTIADMLAVAPASGKAAFVLGYHVLGDGGGGVFRYSNSGDVTDGALVFASNLDLSTEQQDAVPLASLNGFGLGLDVAWGTVGIDLDTTVPTTLTDIHLHGHQTDNNTINPIASGFGRLDYKTGTFTDRLNRVMDRGSSKGGTTATVRRKTITTSRRWVRVPVDTDVFHLAWTGATGDGTDTSSGHLLCWAFNTAVRNNYPIMDLDQKTVVQSGIIEIPMNMIVRHGKIQIRGDDWAMLVRRTVPAYDFSDPEYYVDQMDPWTSGTNSSDGSGVRITLHDLELDGNIAGNQDPLNNPGNYTDLEDALQNTPTWSGFSWMDQNARTMPDDSFCDIEACHFHDYGSNCLLGYYRTLYQTRGLRVGNSARNHLFYAVNGDFSELYMYGFAWGTYSKSEGIKVANCTAENLVPNPYFTSADTFFHYEGDDWVDGSLNEINRFAWRPGCFWQNVSIKIEDGVGFTRIFGVLGQNAHFEKITVVTNTDSSCRLIQEFSSGNQTGMNRNVTIKDATMIIRNGPNNKTSFGEDLFGDTVSVENAVYYLRKGFPAPDGDLNPPGSYLTLSIPDTSVRIDPGFLFSRFGALRGFSYTGSYGNNGPVRLEDIKSSNTEPVKFVVENGFARIRFGLFVNTIGSSGDTGLWTINDPAKFQGYWRNVTFDVEDFDGRNMRAFLFTAAELSAVTATWTTVVTQPLFGEQGFEFELTLTGGETFINIPTDLLWVPKTTANVSVEALNADGFLALQSLDATIFRDRGDTATINFTDLETDPNVDYRAPIIRLVFLGALTATTPKFLVTAKVV